MAILATGRREPHPRAGRHRRGCLRLGLLILLLLFAPASPAQTAPTGEYQLKAVFLFNFAQFVAWPPGAFTDSAGPLVIGVLGEDPFGSYLDETVRGESVEGHPLRVQRYRRVGEIGPCQVLFISGSESGRLDEIIAGLQGRSILTVCETEGFARRGVMIRFLTEHRRIRLQINLAAAKATGLTISSKLLRPAEIVTTTEN